MHFDTHFQAVNACLNKTAILSYLGYGRNCAALQERNENHPPATRNFMRQNTRHTIEDVAKGSGGAFQACGSAGPAMTA
jgi:hypothetical protein